MNRRFRPLDDDCSNPRESLLELSVGGFELQQHYFSRHTEPLGNFVRAALVEQSPLDQLAMFLG